MPPMHAPDDEDLKRRRPKSPRRQGAGSRSIEADDERPPRHARDKSVRIGMTRVGKGLFARRRYPAETVIGEITGEIIDDPHYGSDYCMNVGNGQTLEPEAPFRYVNHSCEPNCEFDFFDLPEPGDSKRHRRVFLISLREIKPGEELTIHYHWSAASAIACRCQSPSCRGWIVDPTQWGDLMTRLATEKTL